jgi:uncharacterized membrane protein YfcA
MHSLLVKFPESGVTTWIFLPPLVAFVISFFTSMGGVSGAFMLLPFQVSVLGYTAPSVSATNQVFNIVAIPSGVWRYVKEGRMLWPLAVAIIIGTTPGVFAGAWIRIRYLPEPGRFKMFAGFVLLYIGMRLLKDSLARTKGDAAKPLKGRNEGRRFSVTRSQWSLRKVEFDFAGETYSFSLPGVLALCFVVGIAGGAYGIGGGAIVAPLLVTFFRLPVHTIAAATLLGTFVSSVVGVFFYQILQLSFSNMSIAPDWLLGALFGVGGSAGMYLGARCQRYVPARAIKLLLCTCVLLVALKYVASILTLL